MIPMPIGLSSLWRTMCYTCNISDNISFHQQFNYKETIYEFKDVPSTENLIIPLNLNRKTYILTLPRKTTTRETATERVLGVKGIILPEMIIETEQLFISKRASTQKSKRTQRTKR